MKMEIIKEETEDIRIEEVFSLKQEDPEDQTNTVFIKEERQDVKIEEDTETQTNTVFIKEERQDVKIEEDTETQTNTVFIKEESEDIRIEELFCLKQEDAEEQTGLVKEEGPYLNEVEDEHQGQKAHDITAGEIFVSCSKTESSCSQCNERKEIKKPFTCSDCGNERKAHRKDFMMGKSKELSQDLRNLIVEKHFDGNGYRCISRMLNVPVSTVGAIIRKWNAHQFTINRPRSGAPRKIPVRGVQRIIRRVLQEPRTTRAELQEDLASAGTVVSKKTISNALNRHGIHARSPRKTPLLNKKHVEAQLEFAKQPVDY